MDKDFAINLAINRIENPIKWEYIKLLLISRPWVRLPDGPPLQQQGFQRFSLKAFLLLVPR